MTWEPTGEPVGELAHIGAVTPELVLFEFEGPRVFTTRTATGDLLLAYVCQDYRDGLRYLLVPTSERIVGELASGRLTLRRSLEQPWIWLVVCDADGVPVQGFRTELGTIPERNLPHAAARLGSYEPALRVRLVGAKLGSRVTPASVVRRAVDSVSSGLKSVFDLAYEAMPDGRPREDVRRLYDLPVESFGFSSFEVAFGDPLPPSQVELPAVNSFEDRRAQAAEMLRSAFEWLQGTETEQQVSPDADTNLALLRALERFAPPLSGVVEAVEVSGGLVDRQSEEPIRLDRNSARRIRRAVAAAAPDAEELVFVSGVIGEIDRDKFTFTLRQIPEGRPDQRCRVDETDLDDALEYFVDGARVKVVGRRARKNGKVLAVLGILPQPDDDEGQE